MLHIIKWLINYYFCQSLKKSEISVYYKPVYFSTSNENIFTEQYSFYLEVYRRRVDFMHNIPLATVRLRSEAAGWNNSGKYVLLLIPAEKFIF